jgi:cardiolipin synthase
MTRGVRDPAFRRHLEALTGASGYACPPVQCSTDGPAAFAQMHAAIAGAREEILLETYILRDDRLGTSMQAALMAAAARGVRVCVLADAVGSLRTADAFWERLSQAGVLVRLYHRFWRTPWRFHHRDHRKLLVIDRAQVFTGGMNIADEYGSSLKEHVDAWRDSCVALTGPVVPALVAVFADGWVRSGGPPLSAQRVPPPERLAADAGDASAAYVLASRPGIGQREMVRVLAMLAASARERLWITTPYFAPPSRGLRMLGAAAKRGVDVRLLLPSARADVPIVRHAGHGAYAPLLARGVRIFEYTQATLHAKSLVVDDYASLVGSSNLDFRSLWFNAECNVLLLDSAWGKTLADHFLHDLATSEEITWSAWRARPLMHRILDRVARAMRWAW